MGSREIRVGADRLERWVAGFRERHGPPTELLESDVLTLRAPDGATAVLHATYPPLSGAPTPAALAANAGADRVVAVLLVRRGGYACAVVHGDRVTASKVGSRYVQGRTAAGGWSQQRFARRREGQAKQLLGDVVEVAQRVLLPAGADVLATGGDRALVTDVLNDTRLASLRSLDAGPYLEVGDPKSDVVKALPDRLRAVRITLTEP
ncbi:acVLRF1 family peptidyl-tRNA hydrolase [Spongisporangium articulatum]|uniref:AcVLRF1 family peptidyl-tRNA hydrolase n=1 Tax=Spongisporangium articulatum TaxID=3362603 RepID=A0ABW8ARK0_9ACTN